ncbi:MAG TPA: Stk1 family PASTA domain-containing Ser/Thr kinase [Mobilitalea sp.]|nr:Stk1 family PASTA domain-containing Ser/Thr kinase [Mobilitalea sp.]
MLKPGMFINDRYEIIDKVGSGGMADVYKARDQRLNRFVAIKVLKPEYSSDKSFVNKFRGEAQSAAGLSHPNIVNVYDVGDDSGLHYIVMELVEGITLKRFIERKGKLEVKEAVGIAIQIAQGMEAAHDNHIIHRDIKPQNIIISRDGKVKVTDFGIAKATNSNTITSNAMGSVHYLSPEQARGGYSDEKSDIYSLGVTIYEMLSGKVPFAGDNTVSVALLHIQGEAMPLRELDASIPVSIDKIVQKCMQKRPERRYHSASELIADLKRAITNPDGDFVQIPAFVASDSPTINISDDLGRIKSSTYLSDDDFQNLKNEPTTKVGGEEDDDEDLDAVDSKLEKFTLIGSIAAVVVLAAVIIFLVIWFIFPRGGKTDNTGNGTNMETTLTPSPSVTITPSVTGTPGETYKVPSVIGLTQKDAEDSIKALDPNAQIRYYEDYSDQYDKGKIMAQYPQQDNDIVKGSEVLLTVSTGKQPFEVPNVYNLTEDKADKKLLAAELVLDHQYVSSDEIEEGRVISTTPERQTMVVKGDTVMVIVSTGPETKQATVPKLIGSTETEADVLLSNAGLKKGNVSYEASTTYAAGKVTYQSNTAGQKVDQGTKIDIIISTGSDTTNTGGSGTVSYVGKVTIDVNPFNYITDKSAEITLDMEQDGEVGSVYDEILTSKDFPLTVTDIEGSSASDGTVTMLVNGIPFKMPGDTQEKNWTVKFNTVR